MSKLKLYMIIVALTGLVLLIFFPGRQLAREHVNERTAVTDHPLLCTSCHIPISKNKLITRIINADYYSPFNLAVDATNQWMYVVAQDTDELLKVDMQNEKVFEKIKVGNHPHSVIIDEKSQKAYVSNEWSDTVSIIDLLTFKIIKTVKTGNGPAGIMLDKERKHLYVVNSFGSDVSVFDLSTLNEVKRLSTGINPTGIAISPSGDQMLITGRRANLADFNETLITEITLIETAGQRITKLNIESAYLMENAVYVPEGDLAFVTLIRPKNQIPSVQVEGGWMMTHGIGVIERGRQNRVTQFLLDEPNAYYPDPFDIEITPDGKRLFVSSSGVDKISVIEVDSIRKILNRSDQKERDLFANTLGLSRQFVSKRIQTGHNPKGLGISSDGSELYVAEQLNDAITIIDTETLSKKGSVKLGGPERITVARQGRRLFNNAGHTFQNQYSCYTCHPDNHEDGLVYNMAGKQMGRNLTNTQSLREIGDTAPFKWNGKNQTVYKQDGMRFSTVLTRTEQFSYDDLDAITAYIMRGIKQPPNLMYNPTGELTDSQKRGKILFERKKDNFGNPIPENNRCVTCHPAPLFTDQKLSDVSTLADSDDPTLFDTPHLTNVFASPPYLHDGRAKTLEEIWTIYGTDDKHGLVNDMSKTDLNDLINYLKSLRSPQYDQLQIEVQHGSLLISN
ncbi:beta-propeller fold lactonase family protein [Lutimonas saemankumensis]|uniref:YncE family protein n=1 Tax=Lutimonas saemankumensis TaxID=483016 RepID=UPI001CD19E0F|nr:YncE family protein [Lutimonas saemankumensis]MCA0930890.1 beta-propeller fold lactonase family protein [Lutimonas saemankumensis]